MPVLSYEAETRAHLSLEHRRRVQTPHAYALELLARNVRAEGCTVRAGFEGSPEDYLLEGFERALEDCMERRADVEAGDAEQLREQIEGIARAYRLEGVVVGTAEFLARQGVTS